MQFSEEARNAMLDALEIVQVSGGAPFLVLRTGSKPSNCAAGDTGSVLATLTLPADPMGDASGGVKGKQGIWSGTASASGTVGHFRVYKGDGSTCVQQGTVSIPGGGGDMVVNNSINTLDLTIGQPVTVAQYDMRAGNA